MGALFSLNALKSKTVWFGILQLLVSAYTAYQSAGAMTPEVLTTLVTGVGTILLRAVTTQPLSAK